MELLVVWPATYSRRTVCPECNARVRLEDVRFTPKFPCPNCGQNIKVSEVYQRVMRWLIFALVAPIFWALGVKLWVLLLCWIPFAAFLVGLWTYAGKYLLPPRLERCVPEPAPFQGLGLGPN
jgi:hypothetical protein